MLHEPKTYRRLPLHQLPRIAVTRPLATAAREGSGGRAGMSRRGGMEVLAPVPLAHTGQPQTRAAPARSAALLHTPRGRAVGAAAAPPNMHPRGRRRRARGAPLHPACHLQQALDGDVAERRHLGCDAVGHHAHEQLEPAARDEHLCRTKGRQRGRAWGRRCAVGMPRCCVRRDRRHI